MHIDTGMYTALVELLGLFLRGYTTADCTGYTTEVMFQCKMSISPPRGNFDFKFACLGVFVFRGP